MDIIKFDRSLVLLATQKNDGKYFIESFSNVFNNLGYKVLYEGIETDSQELLCKNCKADYLQGYKYSRPIPIEELVNYFEK